MRTTRRTTLVSTLLAAALASLATILVLPAGGGVVGLLRFRKRLVGQFDDRAIDDAGRISGPGQKDRRGPARLDAKPDGAPFGLCHVRVLGWLLSRRA